MTENDVKSIMHALTKEQDHKLLLIVAKEVGSIELAKDCLQEAYRLAMENPEAIRHPERLFGWLLVVAKRIAMDCINRRHVWERVLKNLNFHESSDPYDTLVLKLSLNQELDLTLNKWSSNKRKVFYLHFIKGLRLSEISIVLGVSPSNARQIKHRILQELKRKKTFFQ